MDLVEDLTDILLEARAQTIFISKDTAAFRCRLGCHIGLISVFYRIHHAVLVVCPLAHGAFCIHRRIVASIRKSLADAVGSNGALADGIIIFRPGIAAIFIEGRGTGLSFTRCRIHLQIHGLCLAAVNGGVVVFIQFAGQGLGIEFAINRQILIHRQITANRSVACRFQCTRLDIASLYRTCRLNRAVTSIEANGSNLTVGIYLKRAVGCTQGACRLQIAVAVDGRITISGFYSTVAVNGEFAIRCFHSTVAVDREFSVCSFHAAVRVQGNLAICCFHATIAVYREVAVRRFHAAVRVQGNLAICCRHAAIAIDREFSVCSFHAAVRVQGNLAICCFHAAIVVYREVAIAHVEAIGFDHAGSTVQFNLVIDAHRAIRAVDCELAVCAFDGAISTHSCLGCSIGIAAGVDTVFIHHTAVCTNFDTLFVQGNLVVLALVQNHFIGIGFGGSHVALGVNGSSILLQYIIVAKAHSAINGFHQFGIRCHTGRSFCRNLIIQCRIGCCPFLGFLGICLVQGSESIRHILVDGIEPIYHILVDLLNHLVLGFIGTNPGGGFFGQSSIQVGYILTDSLICFDDGSALYRCISLAHILVRSLFFQIFLHIGDPGIQRCIAGFTSSRFRIQVILQLIRGFVDRIGFVRNPFIQFVVSCFTACHFVVVGSSQRCNAIGCVLVHLLDDCILGLISPDPGCCFLCQGGVQVGHVFADGVGRFYDGPILNCSVCLAYIVLVGFTQHVLFYIGNTSIKLRNSIRIGFNLCIQAAQVFPYRIVLFDISSVFGSLVGHTVRSHFTCYSLKLRRC